MSNDGEPRWLTPVERTTWLSITELVMTLTGALDTRSGAGVVAILAELTGAGTTVVVITHAPQVAERMPRQVAIRDGELVGDSGPRAAARPADRLVGAAS